MRYTGAETPIAVGVLPAAGTVLVEAVRQDTASLLTLSSNVATLLPISVDADGRSIWQWSLAAIDDIIDGFAQIVVVFTHQESGERDYAKVCVRGVMDEISLTRRLVATTV